MKLHPREDLVRKAKSELLHFIIGWTARNKLTAIEECQLYLGLVDLNLKHELRVERHPDDPSKPAGLE